MSDDLIERLRAETILHLPADWKKGRLCPECLASADRPKCMWDMGPTCPRHDPDQYDPSPYEDRPHPLCTEAAARIAALEAELAEAKARARDMHRRAQRAEGLLERMGAFLNTMEAWAAKQGDRACKTYVAAAARHVRANTGVVRELIWSHEWRIADEWKARAEAAEARLEEMTLRSLGLGPHDAVKPEGSYDDEGIDRLVNGPWRVIGGEEE